MISPNPEMSENIMTDYQFKQIIEMVYQILKANFDAGKPPEEILAVIAALRNPESHDTRD